MNAGLTPLELAERLALVLMSQIARRHLEGAAPWSADERAQTLRMPVRAVDLAIHEAA